LVAEKLLAGGFLAADIPFQEKKKAEGESTEIIKSIGHHCK
jgi:hypothetical protein